VANSPKVKLSENPELPVLEGWVNLTEAAEIIGITRQHSYKKASRFGQVGGYKTLHRVGNQATYVVATSELDEILKDRKEKAQIKKEENVD
jgi:hypothetical protein